MPGRIPPEEEVRGYFQTCSNWSRWGPGDQLGTMNYITPEKRRQAAALVKEGVSVTCARPIVPDLAPDVWSLPPMHYMLSSGESVATGKSPQGESQDAVDFIGMVFHGLTITHIDSLAHHFWRGKMYNGHPAEKVTTREGATVASIDLLRDGIVSRGVLLDVAKAKGVKWLAPGEAVFPEDLEQAQKVCGVQIMPGDVLLVRTGALRRRNEQGPTTYRDARAGLHAACLPILHERRIAMLGGDTGNDVTPSGYDRLPMPVHAVGLVAMGLWLLDNANLEDLAAACERYRRWEFMLTIGPLRIVHGTGAPANPIALF